MTTVRCAGGKPTEAIGAEWLSDPCGWKGTRKVVWDGPGDDRGKWKPASDKPCPHCGGQVDAAPAMAAMHRQQAEDRKAAGFA